MPNTKKQTTNLHYPRVNFLGWDCLVHLSRYKNGRLAISLMTPKHEPVAMASINLPEADLADDEILIKDYSENAGILKCLQQAGIVEDAGKSVTSGFVTFPFCRLTPAVRSLLQTQ
jgi:hypothetical protein